MIAAILVAACLQSDLAAGEVRKLGGGMKFTEGPIADGRGNVYFSDIPNNRIMKWDGKELSTWREDSGGANGLRFDKDGSLVVCEGGNRRLTRITMDQKVTVLADSYDGKKLNSPNDVCLDGKGGIYFTDPRYGKRDGMEQDKEGVYYIPPDGGKVIRVVDDMVRPNGIEMGKERLYIADAGGGKVYGYAVNADGTLKDKEEHAPVACDGMKLDEKGNLYTATRKGVEIFDPEGKPLGVIKVPEGPSNLCFDKHTLYITARTSLYAVELK
jgi:gluconolactonase